MTGKHSRGSTMRRRARYWCRAVLWLVPVGFLNAAEPAAPHRLMTLEPGHFHAALFQKEMLPELDEEVDVYARPGADLAAHLKRIEQFNARPENPTRWKTRLHTSSEPLEQMLRERPGDIVILSGRNRGKIDRIEAAVRRGLHVLADKPWIIEPEELPRLETALDAAESSGVAAFDAMTQRFEITCLLPREFIRDPEVFGACETGSPGDPAVRMESVHYFLKEVAGVASLRPPWFFDVRQQGEGLADVGTHLVDLVQWTLFPEQALDHRRDVVVLAGTHRPTSLSRAQFERVTGEKDFPADAAPAVRNGLLECFANNTVTYRVRGVAVRLEIQWDFVPPPGARDSEHAVFRGTRSKIEVRQGPEERFVPEVYVAPNRPELKPQIRAALERRLERLRKLAPGLALEEQNDRFRIVIPDRLRVGHEAHFALLASRFLELVRHPRSLPAWEKPNMLAKYFVTTQGVKLARESARKNQP